MPRATGTWYENKGEIDLLPGHRVVYPVVQCVCTLVLCVLFSMTPYWIQSRAGMKPSVLMRGPLDSKNALYIATETLPSTTTPGGNRR